MNRNLFLLSASVFLASTLGVLAQADGPPPGYKLQPEQTFKSPDKTTTVQQYAKVAADGSYIWQFWARHQGQATLLEPEQPDYSAGFRFTDDSVWLVRMQKTGAGYATLHLYHLGSHGFVLATKKSLGDLAWDFFFSTTDGKKFGKPDFHVEAGLVKGTEENYRWMGEHWPNSRYLVIYLAGQATGSGGQSQARTLHGWHCRYDLQTGTFDVPPTFSDNNAKALVSDSR